MTEDELQRPSALRIDAQGRALHAAGHHRRGEMVVRRNSVIKRDIRERLHG